MVRYVLTTGMSSNKQHPNHVQLFIVCGLRIATCIAWTPQINRSAVDLRLICGVQADPCAGFALGFTFVKFVFICHPI